MKELDLFAAEPPAKVFPSPDSERDWLTRVATSCSPILPLLQDIGPHGWYGRTSPAYCRVEKGGTLAPSSEGWGNSGMGGPTESLTLSTSEWTGTSVPFPSDDDVCSLSDILETGTVPQRYYLSAKACRGILRRAVKRGKELPAALEAALQTVAGLTES